MKKIVSLSIVLLLAPVVAFGADDFETLLSTRIQPIITGLAPVIMAISIIFFIYGVTKYIRASDQPKEREKGRDLMVYAIIALFVMVSMWGLINVIVTTIIGSDTPVLDSSDIPSL